MLKSSDKYFFFIAQCRLETLALLVESKKSTLRFTQMELHIICLFLKYNLCEKMEFVPFIKKVIKKYCLMVQQNLIEIKFFIFCRL